MKKGRKNNKSYMGISLLLLFLSLFGGCGNASDVYTGLTWSDENTDLDIQEEGSARSGLEDVSVSVETAGTKRSGDDGAAADTDAELPGQQEPKSESSKPVNTGLGEVRFLNFKPETDEAWQKLAASYTEQTGVSVTVLTAANGIGTDESSEGAYLSILREGLQTDTPPTIFNVGNLQLAGEFDDYTYDLANTPLYEHLSDKSLSIEYHDKVAAVANCYECYGIICNRKILEDYGTMENAVAASPDEIHDFETLRAVAEDINGRVDEINETFGYHLTEAFASAGLDDSSSWRFSGHLANLPLYYEFKDDGVDLLAGEGTITGKYLDNYKKVWDMYIHTSAAPPSELSTEAFDAERELGMGEAVFYQNGDWEYAAFSNPDNGYTVRTEELSMLPIYFGVEDESEGLCVGTENYWAVNGQAGEDDIAASLDFLEWVITSEEGRLAMVEDMGLSAPFDTFTGEYASENGFAQCAGDYMAAGKISVAWSFNATPNVEVWRAGVVAALAAYTDGSGDWDDVAAAFVQGWEEQWRQKQADKES